MSEISEKKDDEKWISLNPGDIYHVKPGQIHRFGADATCDTMLMEVSTNFLDDVFRIKDDYER